MRTLPNLDLLRSFAVGCVLVDHTLLAINHVSIGYWSVSWLGIFGVYLFFVHTALVLMWSLERHPTIMNFYIRRAFRIYPLAMVAVAAALLFHVSFQTSPLRHIDVVWGRREIVENFLLMPSFRSRFILGIMWSLKPEVQMYVLLPAIFLFAHREKRLWQVLVLWSLAVLVGSTPGNTIDLVAMAPNFVSGVIAYLAFQRLPVRLRECLPSWLFGPFLLLLASLFMLRPGVALSWPLMLCLGLALPLFRQIAQAQCVGLCHTVAKYSYGIYLGHAFGIAIAFYLLAGQSLWLQLGVELAVTSTIAILGYHCIEEPLIRLGSSLASRTDNREASLAV